MLTGIHRIGTAAAFDELVNPARRHGMSVVALAEALVVLASGNEAPEPTVARAARTEWRALLRP
ncbi:transcription antitermination regulator [Rhodococcus sp. T7]|uniref:transcription antitermination regulator n=1 Tax=Rhodococcus sp. T7 TaxID=627444 RepID=UPI0013C7DA64|nr:transcription antitermination regulator [Rhodococcus sp. T7]KAF0964871.1 hypothetical protein MLGJGCBP_01982 [Rhodococcus sp. T7]